MVLYVGSWTQGAGKTSLCAGIGRWGQRNGKKVAYLKPVALASSAPDKDAGFLRQVLALAEPVDILCPFYFTLPELKTALQGNGFKDKVKQACGRMAEDKNIVLLEGVAGLAGDADLAQASQHIIDALNSRVIFVVAYATDLPWAVISAEARKFGQHLLGIVVNRVPRNRVASVRSEVSLRLEKDGMKLLGVLPEDRLLMGVNVSEIADRLKADVLCCSEALNELVGNIMIGALTVNSGADYFSRKDNKVVIARGERPDHQLAALATSTKCLVLSGGVKPIPQVLGWAEDKGVPVLLTRQDTLAAVAEVEQAFLQTRFWQQGKLSKLDQILQEGLDFASISRLV
jgi:hypothetical protein